MLTINIYNQDCLINGQVGEVFHIGIVQNAVRKIYVKFSFSEAVFNPMTARHLRRQNSWEEIEKSETESPIKKGSPSVKRT